MTDRPSPDRPDRIAPPGATSDPLLRGLLERRLSRREALRYVGTGAGALGLSALLAACGIRGQEGPPPSPGRSPSPSPLPPKAGRLSIANWPLYIDQDDEGNRPTLEQFERQAGIEVTYKEVIEDNESFFGTIREPLAQGKQTGWDVVVLTDWMIGKLIRLGFLEELHHELLPNFEQHAGDVFKDPSYDPGNTYSVPWQAGITGIGYNPELTGRDITRFADLFDPAFKGKVGMFVEMRDTVSLTALMLGIEPERATIEDVQRVQQRLVEQRDAGIVRAYYGNEYADALAKGDLALTMAWSGDVFQLQFDNPSLRFVVPEEGGILWVDNMAIPKGAEHPTDAHEFMDYVYDPEVQALVTEYVNYITPVPEVKEIILGHARDAESREDREYLEGVANSPLVFPTPETEARLHHYKVLDEEEETEWNDLFQQVTQG